jgi:hypothetical protein
MARERRFRPLLLPAISVLAFASVALADWSGPGRMPMATATSASGSLSIFNSRGDAAILSATNLAPGGSATGDVTIQNTGSVRGAFSLAGTDITEAPGLGGGLLSQRLQLVVVDMTQPKTVYSGPLGALGSRELGSLGPGDGRTYRFTATLPDGGPPPAASGGDNAYQGASISSTYVWTATHTPPGGGPNPPGGGPKPPGGGGPNPPGGGGPNPPAGGPAGDAPLQLRVALVRRQPAAIKRQLVLAVRCNSTCAFSATGKLAKRAGLLRGSATASANVTGKLTLRISKKSAKRLARALRSKRGTQMALAVVARDTSGRQATFRRNVALKQVGRGARAKVRMTWQKAAKPKKKQKRARR